MTSAKTFALTTTNVFSKGDYCVELKLGSGQTPVKLIVDTGSSTLVVKASAYPAEHDQHLTATSFAQEVNYGLGGWVGPVIQSSITINSAFQGSSAEQGNAKSLTVASSHIAIASEQKNDTFANADGILGLAYHHLNKGFNLSSYLTKQQLTPAFTFPWPFSGQNKQLNINSNDLKAFKHFLWQQPEQDITPYLTELEQQHLVANKFAFYSQRSSVHYASEVNGASEQLGEQQLQQDPLNQGLLVLGGGEHLTELYQGDFQTISVNHDAYYNVDLISVRVGDNVDITAAPLATSHQKAYCSNAIVDTGASLLVLTADLYQQVFAQLVAVNSDFANLLAPFKNIDAQYQGIDANLLDLSQWPNLYFTFGYQASEQTEVEQVTLTCSPECYWQVNSPGYGKACFKLLSQLPNWPNQSIIGLPLLNNYYVIFDRSIKGKGVIRFANRRERKEATYV